jgi:type IX secretion system PorP/SprF family membrane protein
MRNVLSLLIFLALLTPVMGQQDPHFTQYMFNSLYYNAAAAGVDGSTRASAFVRSQWIGYEPSFGAGGAPNSQMISFSAPLYKLKSGVGGYILNDHLGPQNNLQVQGMYAYHHALRNGKLSAAVKAGFYAQTLNFGLYRPVDPNDPLLSKTGKESQVRPDLGVGVMYSAEKFYGGVSFDHLIKSEFDFGVNQRSALSTAMNITGGYYYDVNLDITLNPSFLVKSDLKTYSFDLSLLGIYKETMWGGLSFRQSEAMILLVGYSFMKDKSMRAGFALDYIIKDQAAKQPASLEFMLSYDLPVNPGAGKKVIRTPRYRH